MSHNSITFDQYSNSTLASHVPDASTFSGDNAPVVSVYTDGSCQDVGKDSPTAGYAVWIDSPPYQASICEPLPGAHQTSQRAEVHALHDALDLVRALRVRKARVISDSEYAVNAYNEWMDDWARRGWTRASGGRVHHSDLWQAIYEMPPLFDRLSQKVSVTWQARNSSEGMCAADALSRQACDLHTACRLCRGHFGRGGHTAPHICQPVCNRGSCEERRFSSPDAFNQHVRRCHSIKRPCRRSDCGLVFGSEESARQHECSAHDDYVHDCDFCNRVFDDEYERDEHEDYCDWARYCADCERWFVHAAARQQHCRAVHDS